MVRISVLFHGQLSIKLLNIFGYNRAVNHGKNTLGRLFYQIGQGITRAFKRTVILDGKYGDISRITGLERADFISQSDGSGAVYCAHLEYLAWVQITVILPDEIHLAQDAQVLVAPQSIRA
jgi:hypothetical protein